MDDETISVSKGVFVFSNEFKPSSKREKGNKRQSFSQNVSFKNSLFSSNLWYRSYSTLWRSIEDEIEYLNNTMFERVLEKLVGFVKTCHYNESEEIPTAVLLTGINMPDHAVQFTAFSKQLKDTVTPHVACLYSQDAQNIKYLMENMINQFINETNDCLFEEEDMLTDDDMKTRLKKNQLNLPVLQCWYENLYNVKTSVSENQHTKNNKKVLVVIIPDFESFNVQVLQKFILIVSCYIRVLPFVFVFGIATSITTLHSSLPYKVSSKICVKVFKSQRSVDYLNNVLENVFFTFHCPFQLGGKVFNLFTDIFLFYDLSVNNFIQNIKVRDLYAIATTKKITKTQEYKECFKLLGFQSKGELSSKLNTIISYLERKISGNTKNKIRELSDKLKMHLNNMNDFTMEEMEEAVNEIESSNRMDLGSFDRRQFKEKLIGMSKVQNKPLNRYGKYRENILEILSVSFEDYLVEPKSFHFHEIFFFDDISIQNHIVGCHRSAIHSALNDPQYYLQCDCCEIPFPSSIRPSMPDISIVYKLHLECGKMINLYDWLQAFVSIIDGKEDDEGKMLVDLNIQARFTQCVAELEYLGFIKTTKRKADHVSRLTWGG
ncbi:origin recognition complex subunit 3 isoform X2 [Leptinotarsa decemlineata]|uniref:origin recognition complex subunit 3 isoform X2 n=1 Tax=Leptinotarsa decemlineata TaxID=7539 RepID=UPI003D30A539